MSVAFDKRTGKWIVRWRQGGRHPSRSFTLKRDADRFDREIKRSKELGVLFEPARGAETLGEIVELWWKEYAIPTLQAATRDGYLATWGCHIRPALGEVAIRELTPGRVDGFRLQLESGGVGTATISKALAILSGICRFAVLRGFIDTNPVREVRKPRARRVRFVAPAPPLTVERVREVLLGKKRFFDAALVSTLAYAGLRPGEALALRWGDVQAKSLLIERATSKGELKATKNDRLRVVRLLEPLKADLAWWRRLSEWSGDGDYVFPNGRGGLFGEFDWDNWRDRIFKPAVKAAGMAIGRPYDLRHSFASLLIHEGRSIVEVATQIGDSVTTTANTYTHVFSEVDEFARMPAIEAIEAAREAAGVRQMYVELGLVESEDSSETALSAEADARIRTADPFITSEVLYQLSYVGNVQEDSARALALKPPKVIMPRRGGLLAAVRRQRPRG
jgi:integrase